VIGFKGGGVFGLSLSLLSWSWGACPKVWSHSSK